MTRPGTMGGTFKHGDQAHIFEGGKIVNCLVVGVSGDGSTITLDSAHGVRYTRAPGDVGRGWLAIGGE